MISKNNLETTLDDTRLTFVRIKNLSSTEEQQVPVSMHCKVK